MSSHGCALNYLGVIAMQSDHLADTLELMRRSLVERPDSAEFRPGLCEP